MGNFVLSYFPDSHELRNVTLPFGNAVATGAGPETSTMERHENREFLPKAWPLYGHTPAF